jgi:ribose transport system substrate-binding protein
VISCTQAGEGCAVPAKAIKEAGTAIGWHVNVFDGQFNPNVESNGIRAAVANHADAIVLNAVDCVSTKNALQEAKHAGVLIYGAFSVDCNEPDGGKPLFDAYSSFDEKRTSYGKYLKNLHDPVVVDWVTANTHGAGHVLMVDETDLVNTQILSAGLKDLFRQKCPDCALSHVEFTGQDLIEGKLASLVSAALTRDPQIDVVVAPYDSSITLGIGQAVEQQNGRKILVTGWEGQSANIEQIRGGGPANMATGLPSRWIGWSAVDELNRLLNRQPLVDEGMGFQAIDKDHNLPAKTTTYYDGNVASNGVPKQDYKTNFLAIWGVH